MQGNVVPGRVAAAGGAVAAAGGGCIPRSLKVL